MSSNDFSNQQQFPTAENVPASEKNTDISKPQKVNVRGVFVDNVTFDEAIRHRNGTRRWVSRRLYTKR